MVLGGRAFAVCPGQLTTADYYTQWQSMVQRRQCSMGLHVYSALSLLRKWLLESAALDLAHFLKSHIDNHA